MNCGKHRRPSIRRPTAARQRYEQSRYPKKPKPHATGTFAQLSAVRRRKSDRKRQPRGKTSPQRRKDRQIRAAPTKTDFPRFRHTPVTRTEPCRHFPAKINFSPARSRQSMPPIPEEYKRLKGCGHNQRPDPSPHGGNASSESRIFAVHLSRLPIRRAADPIDSPHNYCRSHRSRKPSKHVPQAKSSASVPTKENAIITSFLKAQRPESPPRKKDLRERRHYRHGLRPRTNDRRMTDIEIYDCRGKSIFFREPVPNKRRIRP